MNQPAVWGALFALFLLLGAGPGTSLVNEAEAWLGWPKLYLWGVLWWALLAAVVLVAALNRFFFPSRFVIDDQGITARYFFRRQRLRWDDLRRFAHDRNGGYLSSRSRRSWLDAYRGLHILFGEKRDAVIEHIRDRLPKGGGSWAT